MKRFTETEKWRDPWFRKLSPAMKCLWCYITDNCDHAGIWEPDTETAEYFIGARIDYRKALIAFGPRVETLPSGKLRVIKFVKFQYNRLSRDCKPHSPVFACIERHGYRVEPFENGLPIVVTDGKPIEGHELGFQSLLVKEEVKVKDTEQEPEQLPFESAEFREAWELFGKHRREIKKPLTPTASEMSLKQLSAMGEQRAIRCIEHTIAKGWQGLREPDERDVRAMQCEQSEFVRRFNGEGV